MSELERIWSVDGIDYKLVKESDCKKCALSADQCFEGDVPNCVYDDVDYIFMEVTDE